MNHNLPLLRRVARSVRWYCEDVVSGLTGHRPLHFSYSALSAESEQQDCAEVNPATGLLMLDKSVDTGGNPYGTRL